MPLELVCMRGFPGSGKSTLAEQWVASDAGSRIRVSRDDLRASLFAVKGVGTSWQEETVTKMQKQLIKTALINDMSVVIDNTNLQTRQMKEWAEFATKYNAKFSIIDVPTSTKVCIERDAERGAKGGREVGADVIRNFASKFPINQWENVTQDATLVDFKVYEGTPNAKKAVIVDIDNTLADHNGRNPYHVDLAENDLLIEIVHDAVWAMHNRGYDVVIMSGRTGKAEWRAITQKWLMDIDLPPFFGPFMRNEGDERADYLVKHDLFWHYVAPFWDVKVALDDRDQVVNKAWRAMGIPCFQVAPGEF